jgi:tRNA nucleotidyltransferase (CCA-adding enzyme)
MIRGVTLDQLETALVEAADSKAVRPLKDRKGRPLGMRVSKKGLGCIEITLPRKEISTGPAHTDFDIVLDPELPLHEDAKRRDFTFNALYKVATEFGDGVVADPTSRGLYDLERGYVSTTYPTSFRDDPLRILRAARFVARGFQITVETLNEMAQHAAAVDGLVDSGHMSGSVKDEIEKILMGDDCAKALRLLAKTGVLGTLFPNLAAMIGFEQGSRYHDLTTDEHTFTALETAAKVDAPARVRWALLWHDSGKPATAWVGADGRKHYYASKVFDLDNGGERFMTEDHEVVGERLWREDAERMGVEARLREDVATLIREHMVPVSGRIKAAKVHRARVRLGDSLLRDLIMHRMCDVCGKGRPNRAHLAHLAEMETVRAAAEAAGVPASVKDLTVNGRDAMAAGLEGPAIGEALRSVLDEVVCQPDERRMSREWQLGRLV